MSNEQSYNKIATQFILNRRQAKVHELVTEFSQLLKPKSSILDVGCGSGLPNAKYLTDNGFNITGIDISAKLLKEARKNIPTGKFIKSDIVKFNSDKQFEGIIAWDSLFHLQLNQHGLVFRKLHQMLKQGGYLLFTHGGSGGGNYRRNVRK